MTTLRDEEKRAIQKQHENDWLKEGQKLAENHRASYWEIGDWFNRGRGEKKIVIQKAVAATHLDKRTLRDYAEVARKVKIGDRSPLLGFKFHKAVKGLPSEQQREMLKKARLAHWTDKQLREAAKGREPVKPEKVPTADDRLRKFLSFANRVYFPDERPSLFQLREFAEHFLEVAEVCGIGPVNELRPHWSRFVAAIRPAEVPTPENAEACRQELEEIPTEEKTAVPKVTDARDRLPEGKPFRFRTQPVKRIASDLMLPAQPVKPVRVIEGEVFKKVQKEFEDVRGFNRG